MTLGRTPYPGIDNRDMLKEIEENNLQLSEPKDCPKAMWVYVTPVVMATLCYVQLFHHPTMYQAQTRTATEFRRATGSPGMCWGQHFVEVVIFISWQILGSKGYPISFVSDASKIL